ncbi:undecaprenyl-phosphate glucose phosphotransferase [Haliea sp. E17]|uniref:undecaprenyl-phosphate glucose phosphotransferase n=1 Tax=Haliea sp. E17 TaxID=3401576 RepID=UPI003AAF3A2D
MGIGTINLSAVARGQSTLSTAGRIPVKQLFRPHDTLIMGGQLFVSIFVSVTTLLALTWWRNEAITAPYIQLAAFTAIAMWITYRLMGVFSHTGGELHGIAQLTKAWAITTAATLALGFVTKSTNDFSRLAMGGWFLLAYSLQVLCYLGSLFLVRRYQLHYGAPVRTAIVGSHWLARHLVESFEENPWLPDRIIGVIDNSTKGRNEWDHSLAPWLGSTNELEKLVLQHGIRRVYIALPLSCSDMIETIYAKLVDKNLDIIWAPDIFALKLLNHGVKEVAGVPLLSLSESPMARESQVLVKSLMDISVASIALLLLSPLMIGVAAAVKLTSPGPVFFRQQRHGWDGRIIEVLKFRSMHVHSEDTGNLTQACRGDSRVTPVGRFIRRTSIDELPQLFNVLGGSMSLVGPRPHALQHNEYYASLIQSYMVRHRIKPGITGLAQVNGCRGETEQVEKMMRRVEYDIDYINRWSVWLDIKVLVKTPFTLFSKDIY